MKRRILAACFSIVAALSLIPGAAWSDIITLKDGGRLRCEVLSSPDEQKTDEYIRVRVNNSMVWLKRAAIEKIEDTGDAPEAVPTDEALIKRLIEIGYILPNEEQEAPPDDSPKPTDQDVVMKVDSIRGWAYSYGSNQVMNSASRRALAEGDEVPKNEIIQVSGNSRVTLRIEKLGRIGLEGGSQIRFDQLTWDRSVQNYRMKIRLNHGAAWFQIGESKSEWRRVIMNINTVQTVLQNGLIFTEATPVTGGVLITYVEGKNDLNFWRGRSSYRVSPGQSALVSPSSGDLALQDMPRAAQLAEIYQTWDEWKPEELGLELEYELPPLMRYPPFGILPAMHPWAVPIDLSVAYPPMSLTLGEIMAEYDKALERYKFDTGKLPSAEMGLAALDRSFDVPGWNGPYISPDLPRRDTWGSPFVFERFTDGDKEYVGVRSKGPNQRDDHGLGDDIR
ncbi:MAG: hypothetical protein GC154_12075 [bacterium]|nr:hypothetical protein [bacterium]